MVTEHALTVTGHAPDVTASCSCGDYELRLPSRRAAYRWHTDHRPHTLDLDTPRGRGQAAQLARERAIIALTTRHAGELAELEERERVKLGLRPAFRQDRTA